MSGHRVKRLGASMCAALALMGATSCGSGAPLPPIPPMVTVKIREYHVAYPAIPAGRVVFRVVNEGRQYHRLALIPLPAGFPPIRQQLNGNTRRIVNPIVSLPDIAPGSSTTVAADLTSGRWAFVDFSVNPQGRSNARLGVASEFRVR